MDDDKLVIDKLENKYVGIEPMLLICVIAILIIYYYLFSSLGNNADNKSSIITIIFETMLWVLFIIMLLINGLIYIFGIDLIQTLKFWIHHNDETDVNDETDSDSDSDSDSDGDGEIPFIKKKEVFHLPENKYNYENASAICKAYDSKLASFDEINDAYKNGADWCTYGWSNDKMALFPTQRKKWDELQKVKGHEQDCGRPGINGGYINDVEMKYGVNCYGEKPKLNSSQAYKMRQTPIYNKTPKEITFNKKVNFWRSKINDIEMAPFNHNNWSML
jgi:hypothetical protein